MKAYGKYIAISAAAALLSVGCPAPSGLARHDIPLLIAQAAAQPAAQEMFDRARAIIADLLGVDAAQIAAETRFVDDLGADELDLLELAMAMEDEFGIEISDDRLESVVTVGDLVAAAGGR